MNYYRQTEHQRSMNPRREMDYHGRIEYQENSSSRYHEVRDPALPHYDGYNIPFQYFADEVCRIDNSRIFLFYEEFLDFVYEHLHYEARDVARHHHFRNHLDLLDLLDEYFNHPEVHELRMQQSEFEEKRKELRPETPDSDDEMMSALTKILSTREKSTEQTAQIGVIEEIFETPQQFLVENVENYNIEPNYEENPESLQQATVTSVSANVDQLYTTVEDSHKGSKEYANYDNVYVSDEFIQEADSFVTFESADQSFNVEMNKKIAKLNTMLMILISQGQIDQSQAKIHGEHFSQLLNFMSEEDIDQALEEMLDAQHLDTKSEIEDQSGEIINSHTIQQMKDAQDMDAAVTNEGYTSDDEDLFDDIACYFNHLERIYSIDERLQFPQINEIDFVDDAIIQELSLIETLPPSIEPEYRIHSIDFKRVESRYISGQADQIYVTEGDFDNGRDTNEEIKYGSSQEIHMKNTFSEYGKPTKIYSNPVFDRNSIFISSEILPSQTTSLTFDESSKVTEIKIGICVKEDSYVSFLPRTESDYLHYVLPDVIGNVSSPVEFILFPNVVGIKSMTEFQDSPNFRKIAPCNRVRGPLIAKQERNGDLIEYAHNNRRDLLPTVFSSTIPECFCIVTVTPIISRNFKYRRKMRPQ